MGYNTKNFTRQGGDEWVVGGKMTFQAGAEVSGLPRATADVAGGVLQAENQADSTASTIAELKADVNALLAKLKAAGVIAPDEERAEVPA